MQRAFLFSALLVSACGSPAAAGAGPAAAARSLPSTTASPPGAALATPGPAAAMCTDDSQCGTHRCNVAAGRCAFPCETDADCGPPATCTHGGVALCLPKP